MKSRCIFDEDREHFRFIFGTPSVLLRSRASVQRRCTGNVPGKNIYLNVISTGFHPFFTLLYLL
ncbi:hypothetical protein DWW18_10070 [Butyricimonas virosa]|uniref:Uncharacterized protein n=1 Tax=Butyricimonas virosa TaxID=544645 RepID=A0A412X0D4_9BACT|nr:hypothetical protein DWW18_10070 [Butyricimonas virosa]HAH72590.1 hypothetical protein [Butyricimonas virosa]HAM82537.1 hypothetical protein [Butyricimonas sp.]HAP16846.1 hypothetical protein [Butyricimonas virosa]HCH88937.1 hypothetical protein [Butyricimonas sp.]